jgi:hypothetical protein
MHREPMIVHCADCGHEWALAFLPCPISIVVKLTAAALCPMCAGKRILSGPIQRATQDGDAIGWLSNGDTGTSSLTIWHVMMGRHFQRPSVPLDPADFGRCYRLLQVMPSWRARLGEVAAKYPSWTALVAAWDEVEALYLMELPLGYAPKCYRRMQELLKGAR